MCLKRTLYCNARGPFRVYLLKGLCHSCLFHFVNNATFASLFATELNKLLVRDKLQLCHRANVSQALSVADQGEEPGPTLFLDQTETAPTLSKGLDDRPPPPLISRSGSGTDYIKHLRTTKLNFEKLLG